MTLIAKIGDLEIHSFNLSLTSDATVGFKNVSYDDLFPRACVVFVQCTWVGWVAGYFAGCVLRRAGFNIDIPVIGEIADGVFIRIYQPDAVARTYNFNVIVGLKR